ncbi:MAG: hypothetical protein ACR2KV_13800, partial [Solirubrobacteraceae bacterium]
MIIAAAVALVGAVAGFALVRGRDFVLALGAPPAPVPAVGAGGTRPGPVPVATAGARRAVIAGGPPRRLRLARAALAAGTLGVMVL